MDRLGVHGNGTLRRFLRPSNFILRRGSHKRRLDRAILAYIVGRFFCSWISDALGRRASIALTYAVAGVTMSLAGYWNDLFLGGFLVFYLMIMVTSGVIPVPVSRKETSTQS